MKILLIITAWDFGGAEVQVRELAKTFIKQRHEILIVSLIKPNKVFLEMSSRKNITVTTLNMKRGVPDITAIFKLRTIIKQFTPDVIHAHMVHAIILSRISRIFVKIPKLISTAHSINEGGKLRDLLYRFTDFLSDVNTNVSKNATSLYIQKKLFNKNKTIDIPNGIELINTKNYIIEHKSNMIFRDEFNISSDAFIWLAVGRLTEAKDYFNMLKAFRIQKNKNYKLLIAGTGELQNQIMQYIIDHQLQSNIQLIGRRNDIDYLMQNSNAFIMSSAWEGLPIVMLEAQNVGLPILATEVGGCPQLINSENGFIVPPKNEQLLAKSIEKMMLLSRDERIAMGENAIQNIKNNYNINTIAKKWLEIYNI